MYYALSDGDGVIYISETLDDVVKTGVEWFFSKADHKIVFFSPSAIYAFERDKMHDKTLRYGKAILRFTYDQASKILRQYSLVQNPKAEILNLLMGIREAQNKTEPILLLMGDLEEKEADLRHRRSKLLSEMKTLYNKKLSEIESAINTMFPNNKENKYHKEAVEAILG